MAQTQLQTQIIINVTVPQGADLTPYVQQAQQLQKTIASTQPIVVNLNQNMRQYGMTTRRLLLDLRMFSFAVRTLRRELGVTNPVVEMASRGLLVISAVGTGAVSSYSMLSAASKALQNTTITLSSSFAALKTGVSALAGIMAALWPIIVAVGVAITAWKVLEWGLGIDAVRKQIKQWTRDIEELESHLKDLRYEQSLVSEEMQYYQFWLGNVEYAETKMGYATADMTREMDYLNQHISSASRGLSGLQWEATRTSNQMTALKGSAEEAQETIGKSWGSLLKLETWLEGSIIARGLGYQPQGEQTSQNVFPMGGGGGGPVSVSLNFPGAIFNTTEDIEGTLERAGGLAGSDLNRKLEYMRRGVGR